MRTSLRAVIIKPALRTEAPAYYKVFENAPKKIAPTVVSREKVSQSRLRSFCFHYHGFLRGFGTN
jgi:hypothetical protein